MTTIQREILHALIDNEGEMRWEDLAFDLSPHSTPQGVGRAIQGLLSLGYVTTFKSWDGDHSVGITTNGGSAYALAEVEP